jgi:hypothetical protein
VLGCTDAFAPEPNTDVGLYVWAEVEPAVVSLRDPERLIRIRVLVENPTNEEIRVRSGGPPYVFTSDPAQSRGLWGSFRVVCEGHPVSCGPGTDWWGDSVYVFPAHVIEANEAEVKLSAGWALVPRVYHVRAWFNGREGQSATLRVIP